MSKKDLKKLTNSLLKAHTPYVPKLMEKYKLSIDNLATGVQCPNCQVTPNEGNKGACGYIGQLHFFTSRDAHLMATSRLRTAY